MQVHDRSGLRRGCGAGAAALSVGLVGLGVVVVGCASQQMAIAEAFGYAKREQLVDKVRAARDSQTEAKRQFESALKEFLSVTDVAGAAPEVKELESRYDKLKSEYERSESRAKAVSGRIEAVNTVGDALFAEWREELKQYSSDAMRRASEKQMDETRVQYDKLIAAMKAAEGKMPPVLAAFKDRVLFLKHNLNARAIASLQGTSAQIQSDVGGLVREMEASVAEADKFIQQVGAAK